MMETGLFVILSIGLLVVAKVSLGCCWDRSNNVLSKCLRFEDGSEQEDRFWQSEFHVDLICWLVWF